MKLLNNNIKLMNKIITLFVSYMIVVIILFSFLIYMVEVNGVSGIHQSYAEDITWMEATMVSEWLDDHVSYLNSLSTMISVDAFDITSDINGLIQLQLQNTENYRQFFLVDKQHRYIDTFKQVANMTDPKVDQLLNGEKQYIITSPEMHPVLSEALFNIMVPVTKNSQVVGILGATLSMNELSSRLSNYKVYGSGFGWLVDENLTIIAHPLKDLILKGNLHSRSRLEEITASSDTTFASGISSIGQMGFNGFDAVDKRMDILQESTDAAPGYISLRYSDPDGYKRTATFTKVPGNENWYVVFTTFNDKLAATTRTLLLYMAIGLLAVVIASVIASYLLASEITRPINQLIHTVNLFIGGNRGVRATVKSDDEIGTLSKAFNGMADTIIQTTDNVEELIQERTQMLADLNYQIVVRNKELDTMNKELESTNTKLHSLATTDMLTGLQNRHELVRAMQSLMDEVLKGDEPGFSVLFVDLDNFKYYNDTYSHDIGDFLLIEVAKILKSNVRDHDLVARYGGDEFVVLLKHGDFEISKMLSERIHSKILEKAGFKKEIERKIGAEIMLLGKNKLSCSIGIVNYNRTIEAKTVEDLLALADDTMYKAKKAGKSRIVVS